MAFKFFKKKSKEEQRRAERSKQKGEQRRADMCWTESRRENKRAVELSRKKISALSFKSKEEQRAAESRQMQRSAEKGGKKLRKAEKKK